jgi:CRP-like cAMP-binding protein
MITAEELKKYYPFNKMEEKFLPILLDQFEVHQFEKGQSIFKLDDNKVFAKYVIQGAVEVRYPTGRVKVVKDTSLQSYYPIGDVNTSKELESEVQSPSAKVMMINSIFLDHFMVWNDLFQQSDQDSPLRGRQSYKWVVGLLNSKAVQMLPRGHVDQIFKNLEPMTVSIGDEIITEGDSGDYCYIIVKGAVEVFKCEADGEIMVATLEEGSLFGEHALVSQEPRTASVRMMSDGLLMKLVGEKFSSLLKSHVVRWLTTDASYEMVLDGAALLDVREQEEFNNLGFEGSIHIPMEKLREQCGEKLDKTKAVITCSNTGMRCASAAFLLATLGYDVYSMQGGIMGLLKLVENKLD